MRMSLIGNYNNNLYSIFCFISVSSSKQVEPGPMYTCANCTFWANGRNLEIVSGTNATFSHWCREYACQCVCGPGDMRCHSWQGNECVFVFGRFYKLNEDGSYA